MPRRPPLVVVAAIIERDGQILIGQRRDGGRHARQWEFPGGKLEPGETPRKALERELDEELGIRARIGAEITRYEYQYPGRPTIQLKFYRVREFQGELTNRVFRQIRWESPQRLPEYDFVAGDVDFVRQLALRKPPGRHRARKAGEEGSEL